MPRIPQVTAGPVPRQRRAFAGDFEAGRGTRAVGQALDIVSDSLIAIRDADLQAKTSEAVLGATTEINNVIRDLETDGDYASHEQRYMQAVQKIREQFRKGLGSGSHGRVFDARLGTLAEHGRMQVFQNAQAKGMSAGRASLEESLLSTEDLAGQADDTALRNELFKQGRQALVDAVESGLVTAEYAQKRERQMRETVLRGDILQAIRENPGEATLRLMDPKDPLVQGMTEAERQVRIDQALSEYYAAVSRANAQENQRYEREQRALAEMADSALRNADDLLAQNDLDGLSAYLEETRDILPPEKRRYFLQRIAAGGGFGDAQSNRGVYSDLYDRASQGETISSDVDSAFRAGQLDKSDRDKLLALEGDRRFGDAESFLRDSLRVGEQALGREAFIARARSADALRAFSDWKLSHPDASRTEAMTEARQLVKDAAVVDLGAIELAQLSPRYAVKDGLKINVMETARRTDEAFQRGEIDEGQYAEELRRIEAIERAQQQAELK